VHISDESFFIIIVVGLIAGWLSGKLVRGRGFGVIGDIAIGIVGALVGDWLLPRLGIHLGVGFVSSLINATIGAVLFLVIVGLLDGSLRRRW
jgi:uncharacterized membrane protein YeaQ/YmgE (transglycosylase-associated protein family)